MACSGAIAVATIVAALPTLSGAAVLQVGTAGADAGTCVAPASPPCASVGYAISQASDGDIIEVAPGTYKGPNNRNLHTGGVADLTIIGVGGRDATVLDFERLGIGFTFDAAAGNVRVEGLTLTNGFCGAVNTSLERNGGGFKLVGSAATIRAVAVRNMDCTLAGVEYTLWSGGGFYLKDSAALIEDVEVTDCIANHGGGVAGWGSDRSMVRDSVFLRSGGTAWAGTMLMEDNVSTEFHNVHFAYGYCAYGAALDDGATAHPLYKDCIFEYGEATYGGAAYHFGNSQTRWENCIFRHNYADSGTHYISANTRPHFTNCTWYNNTVAEEGGAIRSQYRGSKGPLVFDSCRFIRNFAGTFGGVGSMNVAPGANEFRDCLFEGNVADRSSAGALLLATVPGNDGATAPVVIRGSRFVNNSARTAGGALEVTTAEPSDIRINVEGCLFEGNLAGRAGGALAVFGGVAVHVARSDFRFNVAGTEGGAVRIKNTLEFPAEVHFLSVALENNTAPVAGGALSCTQDESSPTTLVLHDFSISGAEVLGDGAGLHCACAHLNVSDGVFRDNRAAEGNGGAAVLSSRVLCGESANGLVFDNVSFLRNYAAVGGGLVFFDHVSPTCSLPLLPDGSLNASDDRVWHWSDFGTSVRDNVASYGALQATAPAKITAACLSSVSLGGCSTISDGADSMVIFHTAYPGMEVNVRLAMTDDFGQKIKGENAGAGVQVQVEIADVTSPFLTSGLSRFWFDAGEVQTSGLSFLGGNAGEASDEELLFKVPKVLVDYAYLPPGRVRLSMGPCLAGFVGTTTDSGDYTCKACPSGQFAPRLASTCRACDAGTFAASSGSESCTLCPAGHKCPVGASTPIPCQAGQYQATNGSMDCERCGIGKYQPAETAEVCLDCPPGKTTPFLGTPFLADCVCPAGSAVGSADDCQPCPEGFDCQMGSNLSAFGSAAAGPLALQPGYMSLTSDKLKVFKCLSASHCPGGGPAQCASNRNTGAIACGVCMPTTHSIDDECVPCGGETFAELLPLLAVVALGPALLVAVAIQVNKPWAKQKLGLMHCVVHLGMIVSGLQAMGVFSQLALEWFEPLKAMMAAVSLISFNLDILSMSCILSMDLVAQYGAKQVIAPLCVPILAATVLIHRRTRGGGGGDAGASHVGDAAVSGKLAAVVNAVGTCFNVFFISIVSSALLPLVCYEHPDGHGASMRSSPSVLCFDSDEHTGMVVIAVFAILIVPVPFVAVSAFGTAKLRQLFARSTAGRAGFYFAAFRFLYAKFRPGAHYYGSIMLLRGCLICITPIITRDIALQLTLLVAVLCASFGLQMWLQPWQIVFSNVIDGACTVMLLLVLQVGGMAAQLSINRQTVKMLGTIAFSLFFVLSIGALVVLLVALARKQYTPRHYWAFICHHKADASAQTRLLKMLLTKKTGRDIFVDSDNLIELATLFEVVKSDTERLLILLTRNTLRRPWCAGELTTALSSNGVQVLRVEGDTFLEPTEDQLADLDKYIDYAGVDLTQFGITNPDIAQAFRQLLGPDVPCYGFRKDVKPSSQCDNLVEELLEDSAVSPMTSIISATTSLTEAELGTTEALTKAVALSVQRGDPEAVAAAKILTVKIWKDVLPLARDGLVLLCDREPGTIPYILTASVATIVMLSAGSLDCEEQLVTITVAMQLKTKTATASGPSVIPVALPSFQFQSPHSCNMKVQGAWHGEQDKLPCAQQSIGDFFQLIAIGLSIHTSDHLITLQVSDVLRRIPRHRVRLTKENISDAQLLAIDAN